MLFSTVIRCCIIPKHCSWLVFPKTGLGPSHIFNQKTTKKQVFFVHFFPVGTDNGRTAKRRKTVWRLRQLFLPQFLIDFHNFFAHSTPGRTGDELLLGVKLRNAQLTDSESETPQVRVYESLTDVTIR